MVIYYIALIVIALTAFTLSTKNLPREAAAILDYFSCEQGGHDPEALCSRSEFEKWDISAFTTLSYILLGLFPIVNLVYVLNFRELKKHCVLCKSRSIYNCDSSITSNGVKSSFTKNSTIVRATTL